MDEVMDNDTLLEEITADPTTSYWLKNALKEMMDRDPIDAANDAHLLHIFLRQRMIAGLYGRSGLEDHETAQGVITLLTNDGMNHEAEAISRILTRFDHAMDEAAALKKRQETSQDEKPREAWPSTIPPDLRSKLEAVMGFRQFGPQELWGEIRDWLSEHGAEVPDGLPEAPRYPHSDGA